jgi:hypothetical protein
MSGGIGKVTPNNWEKGKGEEEEDTLYLLNENCNKLFHNELNINEYIKTKNKNLKNIYITINNL